MNGQEMIAQEKEDAGSLRGDDGGRVSHVAIDKELLQIQGGPGIP